MNPMEQHERFEMEVLETLRQARLLDGIVFGGGTMLRLCHQLPRYSVDLDFFLKDPKNFHAEFKKMVGAIKNSGCEITDEQEKHFTWLVEFRRPGYPRRLKIEIRKDEKNARDREIGIAFSPFIPNLQVRLTVCTLAQMWRNKVEALCNRQIIRDAYDLEFLLRRGAGNLKKESRQTLLALEKVFQKFTAADFKTTLHPVLPPEERKRLAHGKFSLLAGAVAEALQS